MSGDLAPVAVVVVSWNSAAWLPGCLDSVEGLARPPREIVVVDNASTDGSPEVAARDRPRVRVLPLARNAGFCEANNLGIAATGSPYVLVLNPDTRLRPSFLEELLPAFEDPSVGIAAGKLLRFDGVTLDSAGQELGRSRQPRDRGYGGPDRGAFDRDGPVFGACGAAALYRRAMLDHVADPGGAVFDPAFFAFNEDLDLAWRARRLGWTAAYRHAAVALHARGGSAGAPGVRRPFGALWWRSPEVRFHVLKNRYLTILRNDTWTGYLTHLPFILARDVAMLGVTAVTSPAVLLRLWRERALFRGALQRRRLDFIRPRHKTSPP
jgi:GT2 family glycosyltransferase